MVNSDQYPVVVGGGMAGLMFAAALGQRGQRSIVLERAPSLDEVGAGVQLSPRSVQLLQKLGVYQEILERAVAISYREVRTWDGHVISRTELGEACEERYGAPYLTVHRADLQQALLAAVPPDTVLLARPVARVNADGHSARAVLEDGTEHEGNIVVGADGIRSTVRQIFVPDVPLPSGFAAYRALVPTALVPAEAAQPVVRIWVGEGSHAVVYPIRGGEMLNIVAVVPSVQGSEDWSSTIPVDELLESYLGWDQLLTSIISRVGATSVWALHDRNPLDNLSQGRLALIGDAAHPMLPFAAQGVNQGLEDAWVLADILASSDDVDVAELLTDYSAIRAPQAAAAQVSSRMMGISMHVPDGRVRGEYDADLIAAAHLAAQDELLAPLGWQPPS